MNSMSYDNKLIARRRISVNKMLDFDFHLTTPRLYISYLDPSNDRHCDFVCELISSPNLVKNNAPGHNITGREDGRKFISDGIEKIERSGYGRYLVSLDPNSIEEVETKESTKTVPFSNRNYELVGVVTMQYDRFPGAPNIPDLGFGLLPQYYRKGYATEASQGLVKYFEQEWGQNVFSGYCSPTNEASKKVFQRLGWENRGMRKLYGVLGEGEEKVLTALCWTKGVEEGEEALKQFGL